MGAGYVLRMVSDEQEWLKLADIWDALLKATPGHTVFQSYRYLRLWWRHFGQGAELRIVLVLREGAICGIAPMQVSTETFLGMTFRTLSFIGTRWEVDRPVFFFPNDESTLLRKLAEFLVREVGDWDICRLHEQLNGSASLDVLTSSFRALGHSAGVIRDSDCPYLLLEGGWAALLAGKSQKFRKNLKSAGKKLREMGAVRYSTYHTEQQVMEQLERYRELESYSWKRADGVGVSRNEHYFSFYREMAREFCGDGSFVVRMLTVDERVAAGTFGLVFDGVYYSLQIVHDSEFDRCSPGTYLESLEIEECFGSGWREYEFLGGFLSNKSRWTATFRHTSQLHVYRRSLPLTLKYLVYFKVKPTIKRWLRPLVKSWQLTD